jgi:hypothetical protein
MGSGLGDQIRKAIRAPHAITGMAKPKSDAGVTTIDGLAPTQGNPEADRQEMPILWLPNADARVHQLTFDLHVGDVGAHIDRLREVIEEDYPELQDDIWSIKATSGRALKIARERVEAKVHRRRPSYDAALAQIQKMALAMGGMQGYDGYEGYGLDAYESGALDHEIGHRPVFGVDPIDDIEEEQARSQALATSTKAGIPLVIAMKRLGYTEEEIAASQAQAVLNAQVQTQAAQQGLPGAKPPATIPLDPTSGESGKGITTDAAKETAARTSSERPKGAY